MIDKLIDVLPWRVQTCLGVRPKGQVLIRDYCRIKNIPFKVIAKGGMIKLKLPTHTNLETHHSHFTEIKLKEYDECLLVEFSNIKYIQIDFIPTIVTNDNLILSDANKDPRKGRINHPLLSIKKYPSSIILKGKSLILSTDGGHSGYFHWLCRILTKLYVLKNEALNIDDFDHVIVNGPVMGFKNKSFKELGLPLNKVVFADELKTYELENATIINNVRYHKEPLDFLKNEFAKIGVKPELSFSRIYFSRNKAKIRKVVGEDKLIPRLKDLNFEIIELENYSLAQQAQIFKNAEIIVGPHGATFSNLIFCNPGQKVVEILCDEYVNVNYWFYCSVLGLDYSCFLTESKNGNKVDNINKIDIDLSGEKVDELISFINKVITEPT